MADNAKKSLKEMTPREVDTRIVFSHLEGIINDAERLTSGNFMHHKAAIKLSAQQVISALNRLGLKDV